MKNETTNNSCKLAANHTPTPWKQSEIDPAHIIDAEGFTITWVESASGMDETNAKFIVRAVNSHKELLDAAKRTLLCLEDQVEGQHTTKDALRRAIAKAEGTL